MKEQLPQEPAIGISLNVQISDGRSLVFQTHVAQSVDESALNAICDKLAKSADRLTKHYEVDAMEREIEKQQDMLDDLEKKRAQLDRMLDNKEKLLLGLVDTEEDGGVVRITNAQKREKEKLSAEITAERQQREQHMTNVKLFKESLGKLIARKKAAEAAAV